MKCIPIFNFIEQKNLILCVFDVLFLPFMRVYFSNILASETAWLACHPTKNPV
jgi:hypothetical protein